MNIFVLDLDPDIAASYHNDKHVVKMLLESTQILSTALPYFDDTKIVPYKSTHINHPCSKWARESTGNYRWLHRLTCALSKEYTKRYNKIHKCDQYLWVLYPSFITSYIMTPFVQAMPIPYKNEDVVKAYRDYYMGEKRHIAKWKTQQPDWWK